MDKKPFVGLAGVVVGVAFSELNDQVVGLALPDIAGGLGIGADAATWFRTLYLLGLILGAATGPSLAVVFSARRFLLGATGLVCASSLLFAASEALPVSYACRVLQGVGEGAIIANLIATALKALPPPVRLYGLVFYAMTATTIPALSTSLAALWTDVVGDWRFVFLQALPLGAVSALLIWYGLPQEPPQYAKLKTYDWQGVLLAIIGFGALAVVLEEGERFDWFRSPTVAIAALVGAVAVPLFILREATAPAPLIGLTLLKRRNVLYPSIALILFIIIGLSASQVPVTFLQTVQGYRPLQAQGATLPIAAAQLLLLPATAWLLDHDWADARAVSAAGLLCILAACLGGMLVSSSWTPLQFAPLQALQAVGQPLVVMPLLMMATNVLKPAEGPLGAALVNAPRAVAEAMGAGLLVLTARNRGALHRERILDTLGQNRLLLAQTGRLPAAALHPGVGARGPGAAALQALNAGVARETAALVAIDTYLALAGLVVLLLILVLVVPEKTHPPRIALADQS